jgi:hypothetical protein
MSTLLMMKKRKKLKLLKCQHKGCGRCFQPLRSSDLFCSEHTTSIPVPPSAPAKRKGVHSAASHKKSGKRELPRKYDLLDGETIGAIDKAFSRLVDEGKISPSHFNGRVEIDKVKQVSSDLGHKVFEE